MQLAELRSYNTAARRSASFGLASALFAGLATLAVFAIHSADGAAAMSVSLGASLAIASAGYAASAVMAAGRSAALRAEQIEAIATGQGVDAGRLGPRLRHAFQARVGWQQVAGSGLLAACAAAAAALACSKAPVWDCTPQATAIAVCALLVAAFALLVFERHLASTDAADLPEAPAIAALTRVPIAVAMICGLGCLLLYVGVGAGVYAGRASAVLCLAVAGEMTLRALSALFVPFPPAEDARMVTVSAIAGALVLRRPPPMTTAVRDLFGIDLSRSWALAFVRAAALPVAAVLAVFGWGLSGVEALNVDQRAVYERFGSPVAVFGPGLHLHLPWPVGRLRPVELGVMHDIPIIFAAAGDGASSPPQTRPIDAEAEPGADADRLWDGAHPSEGAYLVASQSRGQQSFESIDIDLRVTYRVGLSDRSALQAAFAVSDPQRLVQARASRLLARYFAHHTLPGILGADRASFSRDIATELQSELDASQAGLDVMAVVVEAIHPPPGAAAAYHAVQAARISAHTAVAEQQAQAVRSESGARSEATDLRNLAEAKSRDVIVEAENRATGFAADRTADARSHESFVLERRLDKLGAGLGHRQLLIVDHRLQGSGGPTLDMRPSGGGAVFIPPAHESP